MRITKLREARLKKGTEITETAKHAGISIMTYYRYESGERTPNVNVAQILARYFNTTVEELFPIGYPLQQEVDTAK